MKRAICFIFAVIIVLSLCGCATVGDSVTGEPGRFVITQGKIYGTYETFVFADQETGVLYLAMIGGYQLGISPLLNADGTPMTVEVDNGT